MSAEELNFVGNAHIRNIDYLYSYWSKEMTSY